MKEHWIETYTGKYFDLVNPSPDDVDVVDIAHSLSMQCRYNGHCRKFYSVAQHSVMVAKLMPKVPERSLGIYGLLHDAAEAYIGDIPSPVKALISDIREVEERILNVIYAKFNLDIAMSRMPEIKHADRIAMTIEVKNLMFSGGRDWGEFLFTHGYGISLETKLMELSSSEAETQFLNEVQFRSAPLI